MLSVAVLFPGCFGQAVPDPVRYDLGVERERAEAPEGSPVLRMGTVRVPARYDDAAFTYLVEGNRWRRDFYHRFADRPGTLLRDAIATWLTNAGLFAAVLDGPSFMDSDLRLHARIQDLYVDRRDPEAAAAVLVMEVEVARSPAGGGELLLHRRFARRELIDGHGGDAVRDAWARVIEDVLRELEGKLRVALGQPSPGELPPDAAPKSPEDTGAVGDAG